MNKCGLNPGDKYNLLTIIREDEPIKNRRAYLCRCSCGRQKVIQAKSIVAGRTKSCGCLRSMNGSMHMGLQYKEYIGKRFDRLQVIEYSYGNLQRCAHLLCKCDCGKEKVIAARKLLQGQAKSCGCKYEETKQRFRDKRKNVM